MEVKTDYELFKSNSKTNPKMTKRVKGFGTPDFTTIDTYYLIERATEVFGFYGKGFGLKETNYDQMHFDDTVLLVLHAKFFFNGGEFPISNSLKMSYMTKPKEGQPSRRVIDEDAWKKLETNTIAKALSRIGFGTDIYMGKFEDQSYVGDMYKEHELISPQQLQELTKGLTYYKVDARKLTDHFIVSRLADIHSSQFEEAKAFIKSLSEAKDATGTDEN